MFKQIKEWLFEYTYTKFLVELQNREYYSHVTIDLRDQLHIIELLKYLGAQKCKLEVYQRPKKEVYDLNMSNLQITNTSLVVTIENERTFGLNYNIDAQANILLINAETMVFELSDSSFHTKLTVLLPQTIEKIIEESKKLSKEHRKNKKNPIN
ncbi:hypothetical protein [Bacillus wiedmannii]|uniref:hypothetical protein n=1 Tax=Bacillus wiedmannii TaxID=1890302 RepID=UPI000D027BB5|nr:hypothetical protein [Bacillus wiedmannii]PRT27744.1 hypothetical protein C6358_28005 [Bacillus wiedmannii]PRT39355.1 hypothetical protein C6359_28040 [Bacillus wiedmannii]